ncbi:sensor domain-containing phosphodiesterase [Agreia bicolorata]|uniref:sensor domain-containing protein n=1 Tax=Agreia bicolorata TaxID=110935 RepID=UPI0006986230|nr:sensor domain-containing phosphodiesterase [Agreia bicolorata]
MPTNLPVVVDYETLFRAGPGGIVIVDSSSTIVQVNDHILAWTGFVREDLIGTAFTRLLPPADRILFSARVVPLLHLDGRVSDMSSALLGKDRVARAAHLSASRVTEQTDAQAPGAVAPAAATVFLFTPRRDRTAEEEHLIRAVRHAEKADALRREAENDLARSTQFDALTSLLSRAGLMPRLADMVRDAPPECDLVTFVLGLDHFRVVNESLGQAAGDQVLKAVAERLTALADEGFLCARVGDDEFVVVGPGSARGLSFADTILELVSVPILVDDLDIVVTASVGASEGPITSADDVSPASLAETQVRQATTAMYKAKATGRNRWKRFTSVVDDSAINEIRLLGEIRTALADEQFRLEYQPQLHVETGRLHGYEALMRWDHPERGVIGPADFIDVAERSGLVNQLGAWACRVAIEKCVQLNSVPHARPVTVSVNVSARQLGDPRLADLVGAMLNENRLDPGLLTLEITETGLITDSPAAHRNLDLLHGLGVRLSIDDFGTGHAGFAYLKDFPVDELKIDGSFVAGLGVSAEDTAIVASCIDVGHAMGMTVVAERIETRDQLKRLTDMGCDIIQGYLYSVPLRSDDLQSWQGSVL